MTVVVKSWSGPPPGWAQKCNIGIYRDKSQKRSGAAWVLRNDQGKVLIHSRRAFSNILSKEEASLHGLRWAIESMHDHKLNRLIFALDDDTFFTKVILRPKALPNFRCQQLELMEKLSKLEWWKLVKEDRVTNRGAFLIAQCVIQLGYA